MRLSRHLQTVHGWTKIEADRHSLGNKSRKSFTGKRCPMSECADKPPFSALGQHLRKFHGLAPDSDIYSSYINKKNSTRAEYTVSISVRRFSFSYGFFLLQIGSQENLNNVPYVKKHCSI